MDIDDLLKYKRHIRILRSSIHSLQKQHLSTYNFQIKIKNLQKKCDEIIQTYKKYEQFYHQHNQTAQQHHNNN